MSKLAQSKIIKRIIFSFCVIALLLFQTQTQAAVPKAKKDNIVKLIDNGRDIFFDSSLLTTLEAINTREVKINELFANKHLDTEYSPIKLEASMEAPLDIKLEDILARAVENNLNLNIARTNSNIAKWQYWNRFSNMFPDLSMTASYRDLNGTFFLNSDFQNEIDQTISSAGIRINYRAFNGGTKLFLTLAEKFYREATDEQSKLTYNQVLLDAVIDYYNLLKSQVGLATQLQALKQAKANFDLSKQFFTAGTGTRYDVLQAEARLARTQQGLINEEAGFRTNQILLAELLNYPLLTPFVLEEKQIRDMKLIDESLTMNDYLQTAFKSNPSIRSTLRLREGALREAFSRIGDFLPTLDIYYDKTGNSSGFFEEMFGITTLGMTANYDIGTGLGVTAATNALKSKAEVKKAELLYAQELQRIEKELRLSYIEYQKTKSLVEANLKELLAAEESLRLAQLRYQSGLEIMTNLITREVELNQAQLNLIKSTADYNIAQARLSFNMGTISIDELLSRY
jgi:outer membrane factor, OMF family